MTIFAKDIYNKYKQKSKKPLSYSDYSKVVSEFNSLFIHYVLEESCEVKLPYHLGYIRVKKYKMKYKKFESHKGYKLPVDWVSTKALWESNPTAKANKKLVLFLNEHREGYTYKIYWGKTNSTVKNKSYYYFKPARAFKRTLANILNNNSQIDYYE